MVLPVPPFPARCVPYAYASPLQISRALVFVQEETPAHYPGLGWESWAHALLMVQPNLWVTLHTAHLNQQGLQRMTRCLFAYLQTDVVEHCILGLRGPHFAQQLVDRQDETIDALAELKVAPFAYGLVTGLAAGNIADLDGPAPPSPAGYRPCATPAANQPTTTPLVVAGPVPPLFTCLSLSERMLFPFRSPFTPAARLLLISGWLLASCSSPRSTTPPSATASPAFSFGAHADSLNGMQGHTFGEPLRNFPGLVLITKEDERGVRVYQMPPAKKRGWFGKHAKDLATYYQFQDGQSAMFRALTTGLGANRTAMREEARFLFGPGKDRNDLMSGFDWEGVRVRVTYSEKLTAPIHCWLEVYTKPLMVVQQAKQRAQLQADNAVSKP